MRRLSKLNPPTGDARQDAVAELRWSLAGEGLTADKLAVLPSVLDLPVVRAALAGVPAEQRPATAFRAVVMATRSLGGSVDARLLRTALGIDYDGDARNLTERRAAFRWVGDPRTLFDREQKMLEALVTVLGAPPATVEPGYASLDVTFRITGRALRAVEHSCVPRGAGEPQGVRYDVEYDDGPDPLCAVRLACPVEVLSLRVSFDSALPDLAATFEHPVESRSYGVDWTWPVHARLVPVGV